MNHYGQVLAAAILATGLAVSGYLISDGLVHLRGGERVVTVRGLAEQDVKADLAIWSIQYNVTGNDLNAAQAVMEEQGKAVEAFLKEEGLPENEFRVQRVEVSDLLAQQYRPDNIQNGRYILSKTYVVRTNLVDLVDEMFRNVGRLIEKGVILQQNGGPNYIFTQLNDIKPGMIAKATKNAREAAQKFAEDSGSRVGDIKKAYQGLFQINARDGGNSYQANVINKRVRVVTTVEYYIK